MKSTSKLLEVLENNISDEELEYSKYLLESIDARERELLKYKKAFEILKDNFFIDLIERQDDWKLGFEPVNPIEGQPRFSQLPKEEAELLEELMSDGKI